MYRMEKTEKLIIIMSQWAAFDLSPFRDRGIGGGKGWEEKKDYAGKREDPNGA